MPGAATWCTLCSQTLWLPDSNRIALQGWLGEGGVELLGGCSRCSRRHRGCTGGCKVDVRNQETQMNPCKPREAVGQILQPAVQCAVHLSRDVGVPSVAHFVPYHLASVRSPLEQCDCVKCPGHQVSLNAAVGGHNLPSVFFFLMIVLLLPTKTPGKWGCDKLRAPRTCRDCSPCRPKTLGSSNGFKGFN